MTGRQRLSLGRTIRWGCRGRRVIQHTWRKPNCVAEQEESANLRASPMARARLYRIAVIAFVVLTVVAVLLASGQRDNSRTVIVGSLLMAATLLLNVPAMSGQRVYLGIAAAAAIPVAVNAADVAATIYAVALSVAWVAYFIFRPIDPTTLNSEYLAEVVAIAGFGGTYHIVTTLLGAPGVGYHAIGTELVATDLNPQVSLKRRRPHRRVTERIKGLVTTSNDGLRTTLSRQRHSHLPPFASVNFL